MMTISNADIVSRLKLLADEHLKADSGTTTTLLCSELNSVPSVANKFVCFISGDNVGVDRIITDYNTNGTLTFDALTTAVTNTDEFCIVSRGFQSDVLQATDIVKNDMRNKGYNIDLFLNYQTQLKELYIYKTIELVCAGLMNDGVDTDVYFVNYQRFMSLYEQEMTKLIADYDADESGTITTDEEDIKIQNYGIMLR